MSEQINWLWCRKCQALAYSGFGAGVCPAGGGHDNNGSITYVLTVNVPAAGANEQTNTSSGKRMDLSYVSLVAHDPS